MNTLLVLGSAPCVHADMMSFSEITRPAPGLPSQPLDIMAIGLDAVDKIRLPLKYVATNHQEDIPAIRFRRAAMGGNLDYQLISYKAGPGVDIVQPMGPVSGSSSLLGALAAISLGYERIILCGCPLAGNAPEGNPYEAFRPGWIAEYPRVRGPVRSMSGWTRELLGGPDAEWLADKPEPMITIGACWDGRDFYPPEYVNILYRSVLRHTKHPFDFVLYIGPEAEKRGAAALIHPSIRLVPIGRPAWWSGMSFWMRNPPGIRTGSILYLDLDQVIIGSLDDLIEFPSTHAYMKDYPAHSCPPGREIDGNASTTLIRNGAGAQIWEEYVRAGMPTWDPLAAPPGRKLPLAVQSIINDPASGIRKDLFPENWICSYKLQALPRGLPEDCRIVSFHGLPKPHQVDFPWVKKNWY